MKSYRRERIRDLEDGMKARHGAAGKYVVERHIKPRTPVGTPESTGDPHYVVTHALQESIDYEPYTDHVDIGTNKPYAPYVHQGTYDFAHGHGGWTEAQAREAESIFKHNRFSETGDRGAMPRPFLVTGLLASRAFLYPIYNRSIN